MAELIGSWMTNPDVLTPRGIFEIFGFFMVLEFIGFLFSWLKGGFK